MIERAGALFFAQDLEERTDGEIRIEFIGDHQLCGQLSCVKKTQQGIVDIYAASTQNSAGGAPYLNVLDHAYVFPGRASQYHFLYSPESQAILRDPQEARHGLKFPFNHCELRGIQLGLKWKGTIIMAPILVPIAHSIGVDPVHFAFTFLVGGSIGLITPHYGLNLYVASGVTGVPYMSLLRYTVPYLAALIAVWLLVALVPDLSTMRLPNRG